MLMYQLTPTLSPGSEEDHQLLGHTITQQRDSFNFQEHRECGFPTIWYVVLLKLVVPASSRSGPLERSNDTSLSLKKGK
jgi:hypothetical protein